jgi:hypothetical protein
MERLNPLLIQAESPKTKEEEEEEDDD